MPSVGAFNLSLVRGCAHYCKLNSLGSLRRVTAASATVICPRGARVYVRDSVSGEKQTWNQMPVVLDTGFMDAAPRHAAIFSASDQLSAEMKLRGGVLNNGTAFQRSHRCNICGPNNNSTGLTPLCAMLRQMVQVCVATRQDDR